MGLKALAEAALQHCAPRTIDRTLPETTPAHSPVDGEGPRTLCETERLALELTRRAIARAALTADQRTSRLEDIERSPELARFWVAIWPPDDKHPSSANHGGL